MLSFANPSSDFHGLVFMLLTTSTRYLSLVLSRCLPLGISLSGTSNTGVINAVARPMVFTLIMNLAETVDEFTL